MRKFFRHYLPTPVALQPVLRWLPRGLQHPHLWHLHRRSMAGGVAVGLFCGLIPGPLQMLGAAGAAALWRVNLPVAVLCTLYTNPFTILPLYWLAYQMGAWIMPHAGKFVFPEKSDSWLISWWAWLWQLGEPLLLGLLMLASALALTGYVLVRLGWRVWVVWHWRARARLRNLSK